MSNSPHDVLIPLEDMLDDDISAANQESSVEVCECTTNPDCLHAMEKEDQKKVKNLVQGWQSTGQITRLRKSLLATNSDGEIPLHLACKYDDSGEMVEVLLTVDIKQQLETKNKIYGNTPLNVAACVGNGKAVEIILNKYPDCSDLLSHCNKLKDTPIHGAASGGHIKILELMCCKAEDSIQFKGRFGRLPLHNACGYGHIEVTRILLEWDKDKSTLEAGAPIPANMPAIAKTTELAEKLTQKEKDEIEETLDQRQSIEEKLKAEEIPLVTPLTQACQFGYAEIVKFLLEQGANLDHSALIRAIAGLYKDCVYQLLFTFDVKKRKIKFRYYDDKFKSLLHYSYPLHNDPHTLTTPFRELIKHMPEVAEHVLQNCVTCNRFLITSENFEIKLNYEFVDDASQRRPYMDDDKTQTRRCSNFYLNKREHPLSLMVKYRRKRLLTHPVVAGLIYDKWRSCIGLCSLLYWAAYSFVFLLFINLFLFLLPKPSSNYYISDLETGQLEISSRLCSSLNASDSTKCNEIHYIESSRRLKFLLLPTLFYSTPRLLFEVFQLIYSCSCICVCIKDRRLDLGAIKRIHYIKDPANWIEFPLFVLSIIFTVIVFSKNCLSAWEWQIGVVVIFLSWIEFIFVSTQFRLIGLYPLMFLRVLKTVVKFVPIAFLLIVAFGLTFHLLLYQPELKGSPYFSPGYSFLKVLSMTTGDVDTDNFFGLSVDGQIKTDSHLSYIHLSTIVWVLSLILMTIILSNLLIGLAVGDIQSIQDEAEFEKIKLQVNYVLNAESHIELLCGGCSHCKMASSFSFKPNETFQWNKTQVSKELIYFVWGGVRYDSQESIERIISDDEISTMQKHTVLL